MTFTPSTAPTDVGASISLLQCHTTAHRLLKQFPVLKEAISVLEADTAPVLAGLDDLQSTAQHLQRSLKFLVLNAKPNNAESTKIKREWIEDIDGHLFALTTRKKNFTAPQVKKIARLAVELVKMHPEVITFSEATESNEAEEVADATQAAD